MRAAAVKVRLRTNHPRYESYGGASFCTDRIDAGVSGASTWQRFSGKKTMIMRGGARGELARACEAQRAHGRPSMHMREGSAVSRLIASRTLALASCTTSTPVWLWPDLVTSCGRELGRARFIQWCACWSPPPPRGGVGGSCPRIDASRAGEPGDMSRLPAGSSAATSVQAKRLLLACRACIRTERLMHRSDWRCRGCSCCQFSWAAKTGQVLYKYD